MPRPRLQRRVRGKPNSFYFKPDGIRMIDLKESVLEMEEFEAMKLIDFDKISQEKASKKMEVSQPTFSRILKSAREKVAEAIIKGKAIKIEK